MAHAWGWSTLFLLGAYHGINPGMGSLFAVALGTQDSSARGVVRSLAPIALGHAMAIAVAVLIAGLLQIVLPLKYLKIVVATALVGLGLYKILRSRHFRWGGMRVGFRDLTIWSFLMASAHGAGLMVLPVVFGLSADEHAGHSTGVGSLLLASVALAVHTAGYLLVTAVVAVVVFEKVGLAVLRK